MLEMFRVVFYPSSADHNTVSTLRAIYDAVTVDTVLWAADKDEIPPETC